MSARGPKGPSLALALLAAGLLGPGRALAQAQTDFPCATSCANAIPDEQKGVAGVLTSTVTVPSNPCPDVPNVTGVGVLANVTHSWSGDLKLTLTHPNGTTSHVLRNASAAFTDDANLNVANISTFDGLPRTGTWTLKVEDTSHAGTGALEGWTLILYCRSDLSVALQDAPDPLTPGNQLTYTVTGTNSGPALAHDLTLAQPIPAGTSFVSASTSPGGTLVSPPSVGATSGTVTAKWTGTTAVAGARTLTVIVKSCPDTTCAGSVAGTATVSALSPPTDPSAANNTANAATTPQAASDLAITQSAIPTDQAPGGQVTLNIEVTNAGPSNATAAQVIETLPSGWQVVSSTPPGVCTGLGTSVATCQLGNLAAPASCAAGSTTAQLSLVVAIPAGAAEGGYNAGVTVSSANCAADPDGSDDATSTPINVTNCVADTNPPTVTPPSPATITVNQSVCAGGQPGTTIQALQARLPQQSTDLAAFVSASTAVDACTAVTELPSRLGSDDITNATFFPVLTGVANTVTFRWQDAALNVGTATGGVLVRRQGDVDEDGDVDIFDNIIIQGFLVGNLTPGQAPFLAPASVAWADADTDVDIFDIVLQQAFIVGNVSCLTP